MIVDVPDLGGGQVEHARDPGARPPARRKSRPRCAPVGAQRVAALVRQPGAGAHRVPSSRLRDVAPRNVPSFGARRLRLAPRQPRRPVGRRPSRRAGTRRPPFGGRRRSARCRPRSSGWRRRSPGRRPIRAPSNRTSPDTVASRRNTSPSATSLSADSPGRAEPFRNSERRSVPRSSGASANRQASSTRSCSSRHPSRSSPRVSAPAGPSPTISAPRNPQPRLVQPVPAAGAAQHQPAHEAGAQPAVIARAGPRQRAIAQHRELPGVELIQHLPLGRRQRLEIRQLSRLRPGHYSSPNSSVCPARRGGSSPRWRQAPGVRTRPRGVRAIMPACIR